MVLRNYFGCTGFMAALRERAFCCSSVLPGNEFCASPTINALEHRKLKPSRITDSPRLVLRILWLFSIWEWLGSILGLCKLACEVVKSWIICEQEVVNIIYSDWQQFSKGLGYSPSHKRASENLSMCPSAKKAYPTESWSFPIIFHQQILFEFKKLEFFKKEKAREMSQELIEERGSPQSTLKSCNRSAINQEPSEAGWQGSWPFPLSHHESSNCRQAVRCRRFPRALKACLTFSFCNAGFLFHSIEEKSPPLLCVQRHFWETSWPLNSLKMWDLFRYNPQIVFSFL